MVPVRQIRGNNHTGVHLPLLTWPPTTRAYAFVGPQPPEDTAIESYVAAGAEIVTEDGRVYAVMPHGAEAPVPAVCESPWSGRTRVMAILNVTPDSFSGDGLMQSADPLRESLRRAEAAVAAGASILDVGGASTRPGSPTVKPAEERARVEPVVKALAREYDIPISIDTFHAEVAGPCLDHGAAIVNSVWGIRRADGSWNDALVEVVADRQAGLVLTHNENARPVVSSFGAHYEEAAHRDIVIEVADWLSESAHFAERKGVNWSQLIVDPGIGFGKGPEQNLELLRSLPSLRALGMPLLVSVSRKSVLGYIVDRPPHERDDATVAATALAVAGGAEIIRAHSVRPNVDAARLADRLCRTSNHREPESYTSSR